MDCYLVKGSNPRLEFGDAIATAPAADSYVSVSATAFVAANAGDTIEELCYGDGPVASYVESAGIIAIRVLFFTGTPPVAVGAARSR